MCSASADVLVLHGYSVDLMQPGFTEVDRLPGSAFVISARADTGVDTDHFMLKASVTADRSILTDQVFSGADVLSVVDIDKVFSVSDRSLGKRWYDS